MNVDHRWCKHIRFSILHGENNHLRKITCEDHGVYWIEEDYRLIDGPIEKIKEVI